MYGSIYYNVARPSAELLAAFHDVSTAALSDAMGRHGAMRSVIRPIYDDIRMVGAALTVLCFPGDNIMTHKALELVQPGDVLVIDDGDHDTGCFGHRSAMQARARGGVGLVASGSVRDIAALRHDRFPAFCRGASPRAPQKNTPGSINVPVHIGGLVVRPGDIVVGDPDGVVVVPLGSARQILDRALARERLELRPATSTAGELPPDPAGRTPTIDELLRGRVTEHRAFQDWSAGFTHNDGGKQ
jgi:4-hydroxy-4-methyl-2-oxoglutarate aldolase